MTAASTAGPVAMRQPRRTSGWVCVGWLAGAGPRCGGAVDGRSAKGGRAGGQGRGAGGMAGGRRGHHRRPVPKTSVGVEATQWRRRGGREGQGSNHGFSSSRSAVSIAWWVVLCRSYRRGLSAVVVGVSTPCLGTLRCLRAGPQVALVAVLTREITEWKFHGPAAQNRRNQSFSQQRFSTTSGTSIHCNASRSDSVSSAGFAEPPGAG